MKRSCGLMSDRPFFGLLMSIITAIVKYNNIISITKACVHDWFTICAHINVRRRSAMNRFLRTANTFREELGALFPPTLHARFVEMLSHFEATADSWRVLEFPEYVQEELAKTADYVSQQFPGPHASTAAGLTVSRPPSPVQVRAEPPFQPQPLPSTSRADLGLPIALVAPQIRRRDGEDGGPNPVEIEEYFNNDYFFDYDNGTDSSSSDDNQPIVVSSSESAIVQYRPLVTSGSSSLHTTPRNLSPVAGSSSSEDAIIRNPQLVTSDSSSGPGSRVIHLSSDDSDSEWRAHLSRLAHYRSPRVCTPTGNTSTSATNASTLSVAGPSTLSVAGPSTHSVLEEGASTPPEGETIQKEGDEGATIPGTIGAAEGQVGRQDMQRD